MSIGPVDLPNKEYPHALPVLDVDSEEDAKSLRISFCKLNMHDGRYIWPKFGETLEALDEVIEIVKKEYLRRKKVESDHH